jgi:hypothetical protein
MEFLMGRSLMNSLYNLDVKEPYAEALRELGYDLEVGGGGDSIALATGSLRRALCRRGILDDLQAAAQAQPQTWQASRCCTPPPPLLAWPRRCCRLLRSRSATLRWATAAWAAWRPASWTPWPP